jgi:hypothetical protein
MRVDLLDIECAILNSFDRIGYLDRLAAALLGSE